MRPLGSLQMIPASMSAAAAKVCAARISLRNRTMVDELPFGTELMTAPITMQPEMTGATRFPLFPRGLPVVKRSQMPKNMLVTPKTTGAVSGVVGIEGGVVSGVINLESSGVEALDWRPRHDQQYHEDGGLFGRRSAFRRLV